MDVATPSGKLTLFSTEYLGDLSGYSGSIHNNWSASSICDKLNGRSTYIENGILPTYFTNTEKCDDVINEYGDTDTSGPDVASIDIRQKLVLPSVQEVKDGGTWDLDSTARSGSWWLRSPHNDTSKAMAVELGEVYLDGLSINDFSNIRPIFNLNLESVLFSSARGESKSSDFRTGTTTNSSTNIWNLTLQAGSGFAATRKSGETGNVEAGNSLTVYVTNAGAPDADSGVTFNQISAMLVDDDGTVIVYGKIADSVTAGDISVTIPTGVADGNYKLKVFAEKVNSSNSSNLTDYATNMASIDVTIVNPSTPPIPHHNDSDSSSDDSNSGSSKNTNGEFYVNPLVWTYKANQTGSMCLIEHQGSICVAAFKAATPKGFTEAFSFNLLMIENGYFKPNFIMKNGEFVLYIPKEWQKAGRIFVLIGIDKNGKTQTFTDKDLNDESFTTTLNIEGYAFSLIYSDIGASSPISGTTTGTTISSGIYTVQEGDTLSGIAKKLEKTRATLLGKNKLENPNKLNIGQKIYY